MVFNISSLQRSSDNTRQLVNPQKRCQDDGKDINLCVLCKKVKNYLQVYSSENGTKNIKIVLNSLEMMCRKALKMKKA